MWILVEKSGKIWKHWDSFSYENQILQKKNGTEIHNMPKIFMLVFFRNLKKIFPVSVTNTTFCLNIQLIFLNVLLKGIKTLVW